MIRKSIHCRSCEAKCDIIVRQTNYDDDYELETLYCPVCSASLEDFDDDYEEYDE